MKKIEDNAHYHDVLKFKELEAALTAEKARMKPDPIDEEANVVQASSCKSCGRASTNQSTNPKSNNASSTIITCK